MKARMQYCLSPAHIGPAGPTPWFFSTAPSRYCPLHQGKPRLRFENGEWLPVKSGADT